MGVGGHFPTWSAGGTALTLIFFSSIPLDLLADDRLQAAVQRHGYTAENVAMRVLIVIRRDGEAARWSEPLKHRISREIGDIAPATVEAIVADLTKWGFLPDYFFVPTEKPTAEKAAETATPTESTLSEQDKKKADADFFNAIPVPFKEPKWWSYPITINELYDEVYRRESYFREFHPTQADGKEFFKFLDKPPFELSDTSIIPLMGFYRWLEARRQRPDILKE